jgi:Tetratricopeptide repeat
VNSPPLLPDGVCKMALDASSAVISSMSPARGESARMPRMNRRADGPQDWPRWTVLLPHVLAVTSLSGQAGPDVAADTAWLLDRAAAYLQVHARLADARSLAERALVIDEAALGPDHPAVAIGLGNLALILRDLGLAGEARPLAERVLAIAEAARQAKT